MNAPAPPPPEPTSGSGKIIGGGGLAAVLLLAATFAVDREGLELKTYADPVWTRAGKLLPTACAGDTGPHIRMGMEFTIEQCMRMLGDRHYATWKRLEKYIQGPMRVETAVSVLSLADNVGVDPVAHSTLLRLHNAGHPRERYCLQFTQAMSGYVPFGIPVKLDKHGKLLNPEDVVRQPIGWVRSNWRNCRDRRNKCYGLVDRREREQAMCLGDVAKAMAK